MYYINYHSTNHNVETYRSKKKEEPVVATTKATTQVGKPPKPLNYPCCICGIVDHKLMNTREVNENTTTSVVPDISTTSMAIDNHMVVIQVQIGRNTIDDVLLDGGFGVNIITKQSRARLGLPKPKPIFYNL